MIGFTTVGSPTAGAQPTDGHCASVATTTPALSTTPAGTCSPESPSATSTVSTPPSESTTSPSTESISTATSASTIPTVAIDDPAPATAAAAVTTDSFLVGPGTVAPGQTWIGTMNVAVTDTGEDGWTSSVSLSTPTGTNTGHRLIPEAATYSAPASACSPGSEVSPTATVQLTEQAQVAKIGGPQCVTEWPATVSIRIPATGVLADTYHATLTHSVY